MTCAAREQSDTNTGISEAGEAPRRRLPPRGPRSFRRNIPSETDDASVVTGQESTSEVKTGKEAQEHREEEEEEAEEGPIVRVQEAVHVYPLEIFPSSRSSLALRHPLLYFPAPSPDMPPIPGFFSSTAASSSQRRDEIVLREDRWQIDSQLFCDGTMEQAETKSKEESSTGGKTDTKSRSTSRITRSRKQSHESENDDDVSYSVAPTDNTAEDKLSLVADGKSGGDMAPLLQHWVKASDGVFVGRGTVMSDVLLRSEEVAAELKPMISRGLALSRATQRLLRDFYTELNAHAPQREFWRQLHYQKRSEPVVAPLTDDGRPKPGAWKGYRGNTRVDDNLAGGPALLRQDEKGIGYMFWVSCIRD